MPNTYTIDSGNVARKAHTVWAIDSGGVARKAKKIWVIDSGGVARLVFQPQITFGIVTGSTGSFHGYSLSGSFGTINSVNGLDAGLTIDSWEDNTSTTKTTLIVVGFAVNPGSSFFIDITMDGINTLTSASATYSYASGTAQWVWSGVLASFGSSGTSHSIVINR